MRLLMKGPEVAARVESLVRGRLGPWSDSASARLARITAALGVFGQQALARRTVIVPAAVLFVAMLLVGLWAAGRVEHAAVQNAANQMVLQTESLLATVGRDLGSGGEITPQAQNAIDALFKGTSAGGQVVTFRIWKPDASLSFASDRSYIGRSFPVLPELATALKGNATGVYNDTRRDRLDAGAEPMRSPLFEIFVPVRSAGHDAVIGVAEFHQNAAQLETVLSDAKRAIWLVAGLGTLAMFGTLYGITRRSGRVTAGQREVLEQQDTAIKKRIADQDALYRQIAVLRQQLDLANRRGTEFNERFLRRISSDLHDGPAQHLALALLRLDELAPLVKAAVKSSESGASPSVSTAPVNSDVLSVIRRATSDALREIRNISSGLALPELQKISPADALGIAARAHERATGTSVAMTVGALPSRLPLPITICLFRFAQEGLNNAFRHAGGKGQQLHAKSDGVMIEVEVIDSGPGFFVEQRLGESERIGLSGLRHRVESLGGSLNIHSVPGLGTRLGVRFPQIVAGEKNG